MDEAANILFLVLSSVAVGSLYVLSDPSVIRSSCVTKVAKWVLILVFFKYGRMSSLMQWYVTVC